jgi:hypothetical protein
MSASLREALASLFRVLARQMFETDCFFSPESSFSM